MKNKIQMNKNLQAYLQYVEKSIAEINFPKTPASLYEPMTYILSLGGKRIRPVLTLMSSDIFCGDFSKAKNAACAVELFHNFSLIHDDIMDNAPLRRGQKTVHEKWNTNIAILSGDAMLIEAYKLLIQYSPEISSELIDLFNKTAIAVCEGQQMDMDFENSDVVSKEDYLEMIRLKTAVLLGCSFKMGAVIANTSAENQKDIYNFGVNLGIAFQLQDDILDLYADQSQFGKQVGGDILANKKTYLLLSAIESADQSQKKDINAMLNMEKKEEKISLAKSLFHQLKVKEQAEEKMNHFYQTALSNVNHLQIAESSKEILRSLAEYLMSRNN